MSTLGSLATSNEVLSAAPIFTPTNDGQIDPHETITPLSPAAGEVFNSSTVPSFEAVLSGQSQAPYSRVAFSDFLKRVHCSENLEFLIISNQLITTDAMDLQQQEHTWHFIYATFISSDSPKEVNIPHDLKDQLFECFDADVLPTSELITRTMLSIKDLLRDAYVQFIQNIKKQQRGSQYFTDRVNENYCLLPTPTDESPKDNRRISGNFSPLEPQSGVSSRCVSPLSNCDVEVTRDYPRSTPIPRSVGPEDSESSAVYSSGDESNKKDSVSSQRSTGTKNSSFSESSGLKKFAGKFRWRRLSSNSSTTSN